MSIDDDFNKKIVASIKEELKLYSSHCHYDNDKKKIIYHSIHEALLAYNEMQLYHAEEEGKDLTKIDSLEWLSQFSTTFRKYWKETHLFILNDD